MPIFPADFDTAAVRLDTRAEEIRAAARRITQLTDWAAWRSPAATVLRERALASSADLLRRAETLSRVAEQLRRRARPDLAAAGLGS